jgi:hypothetical protein
MHGYGSIKIKIFALQATSFGSGFEPSPGVIQEQRYTEKFQGVQ